MTKDVFVTSRATVTILHANITAAYSGNGSAISYSTASVHVEIINESKDYDLWARVDTGAWTYIGLAGTAHFDIDFSAQSLNFRLGEFSVSPVIVKLTIEGVPSGLYADDVSLGNPVSTWSELTGQKVPVGLIAKHNGGDWLCIVQNTDSEPISGNADWTLVGGTPYVDVTFTPDDLGAQENYSQGLSGAVTAINQGAKQITTDVVFLVTFSPGTTVTLSSGSNDGTYTISTSSLVGGFLVLTVLESIPSATGDGFFTAQTGLGPIIIPGQTGKTILVNHAQTWVSDGDPWGQDVAADLYYEDLVGSQSPQLAAVNSNLATTPLVNRGLMDQTDYSSFITSIEIEGHGIRFTLGNFAAVGGVGTRTLFARVFYFFGP